jgi:hypothetical protein
MVIQGNDPICDSLIQKITRGIRLDDAEKSHRAGCQACMTRLITALDESAMNAPNSVGISAGVTNGNGLPERPQAKAALEHGRRVFEREFGISLLPKECEV